MFAFLVLRSHFFALWYDFTAFTILTVFYLQFSALWCDFFPISDFSLLTDFALCCLLLSMHYDVTRVCNFLMFLYLKNTSFALIPNIFVGLYYSLESLKEYITVCTTLNRRCLFFHIPILAVIWKNIWPGKLFCDKKSHEFW